MVETWASPAGFSKYEVSNDGFGPDQRPVRSVDRVSGGRRLKGVPLKLKVGSHGYLQVNVYDDEGRQRTMTVHALVLLAHVGPCPPGMQVRHLDDDPFNNRWRPGDEAEARAAGGNLIYGTLAENVEDTFRNGRPRRPERHCTLCDAVLGATVWGRCPECVAALAALGAARRAGLMAADVSAALDAVTHGGYRYGRPSTLQRVNATLRVLRHPRQSLRGVTSAREKGNPPKAA